MPRASMRSSIEFAPEAESFARLHGAVESIRRAA